MKKYLLKIGCIVLLLLLLVCGSTACQTQNTNDDYDSTTPEETTLEENLQEMNESDRAFALYDLVNQTGETVDSYAISVIVALKGEFFGSEVEFTGEVNSVYEGMKTKDAFAYIEKATYETKIAETNTVMTAEALEGYYDGKMFRSQKSDNNNIKIWSQITQEEYLEYQAKRTEDRATDIDFDLDAKDCVTKTAVQEDDLSWIVTFTDFTVDGMQGFVNIIEDMATLFVGEDEITDVVFRFHISEDFFLQEFEIEYEIESEKEHAPQLSIRGTVKDYGTAKAERIRLFSFTLVDDIRLLDKFADALQERKDAENGYFELTIKQDYLMNYKHQTYSEIDKGNYTNQNGKYTYNIDAEQGGKKYAITYANNLQKVVITQNGSIISNSQAESDDDTAKQFIDNLLDQGKYSADEIGEITRTGNNTETYRFTVAYPDSSIFDALLEANNGTLRQIQAYFDVSFDGDKLIKYTYTVKASISTPKGTITATLVSTCIYSDKDSGIDLSYTT